MPFVQIRTGIRVYYERQGAGPPLLLIMGTGLDHSCWDGQVAAYRDHFECIVFDNRGAGRTEPPDAPDPPAAALTMKLLAEDAAGLLDALGIARAHVSGLSLGSCVAQELALGRADLVETLQLHGTWGRAYGYAARKFRAQKRLLDVFDLADFYQINALWFITPQYFHEHAQKVADQLDAIVAAAPSREILKAQYQADLDHDTLDRLPTLRLPTLVTVGSFDLALPPMYGQQVAAAIEGSEFVVFDEGGHLHNVERPEEFNRVTLDFLMRHVGESVDTSR